MSGATASFPLTELDPAGYPWQGKYGLQWAAGINYKRFDELRVGGSTGGFNPPVETGGTSSIINNNEIFVNYAGLQPITIASGTPYTNTSGTKQTIYATGGSITGVVLNGGLVGIGNCAIRLVDSDVVTFTFTGSPVFTLSVEP